MIRARQIKAARALLDWTGEDLANATGLSLTTIRNLESGDSPRAATAKIVREAMERRGIEFLDSDGVRYCNDIVKIYQGLDGSDSFFDDLLQHAKETGGEIVAAFKSMDVMARLCGVRNGKLGRLEPINKHAGIKCLVPDGFDSLLLTPSFQMRTILRQHIGNVSYVVYGNRYALITVLDNGRVIFLMFNSASEAHENRKHFYTLWEMAPPVLAQFKNQEQHAST